MGCGALKGEAAEEKIVFKHLGVHSLDVFFKKCEGLMSDFADMLEPIKKDEVKFFESTGFYAVPGASKNSCLTKHFRSQTCFPGDVYRLYLWCQCNHTLIVINTREKLVNSDRSSPQILPS
jgi:hypothetical protein